MHLCIVEQLRTPFFGKTFEHCMYVCIVVYSRVRNLRTTVQDEFMNWLPEESMQFKCFCFSAGIIWSGWLERPTGPSSQLRQVLVLFTG
jgi:hypothetical protein